MSDKTPPQLIQARQRLYFWMRWHWGNHLHQGRQNFLGAMVERAEGNLPGGDISVPIELTIEIEAVEKAVARMRGTEDRYRELIKDTYVRGMFTHEISASWSECLMQRRNWSDEYTKKMLSRAELLCWRHIQVVEQELRDKKLRPASCCL